MNENSSENMVIVKLICALDRELNTYTAIQMQFKIAKYRERYNQMG